MRDPTATRRRVRSRFATITKRLTIAILVWAVVEPLVTAQGGSRKELQKTLEDEVCKIVEDYSTDEDPDCFPVAEKTSTGWLLEVYEGSAAPSAEFYGWARCPSYILIPAENTWSRGVRGFLYLFALLYSFLGIAIVSDIFMEAIETITSATKKNAQGEDEVTWNPTVANLTLMALGSSAPEILLNVVGVGFSITEPADPLGPSTIVGSASFNLLIISAVCVLAPLPDTRKVEQLSVFCLTAFFSLWAYIWLLIILQVSTPGEVEIWEAVVTLMQFPVLVFLAYGQDRGWRLFGSKRSAVSPEETDPINGELHHAHHNYLEYRQNGMRLFGGVKRNKLDSDTDIPNVEEPEMRNGMTSDPYCKIIVAGMEKVTKWKAKKLNPMWDEKFVFDLDPDSKDTIARFEAWDHDELSTDDFMGAAELDLADFNPSKGHIHTLKLTMPNDPEMDSGFVKVSVSKIASDTGSLSYVINVIEGIELQAVDKPNRLLDMMAMGIGRSLKVFKTKGVVRAAYARQFRNSIHPGGEGDDLSTMDCIMHFLAIFWKVLFATIPPPHLFGGWLAFAVCLIFIGGLTAVVGEIASLFGCVAGLSKSLTAITFVALGTSLPDTFASKVAAVNEETADAALGNITGSNAVNVFLGIGLPWTMAAIYWQVKCGINFPAGGDGFIEGVIIFSACACICLVCLALRRYFLGAELGGDNKPVAYASSTLFVFLWLSYIGLFAYFEKHQLFDVHVSAISIAGGCPADVTP